MVRPQNPHLQVIGSIVGELPRNTGQGDLLPQQHQGLPGCPLLVLVRLLRREGLRWFRRFPHSLQGALSPPRQEIHLHKMRQEMVVGPAAWAHILQCEIDAPLHGEQQAQLGTAPHQSAHRSKECIRQLFLVDDCRVKERGCRQYSLCRQASKGLASKPSAASKTST